MGAREEFAQLEPPQRSPTQTERPSLSMSMALTPPHVRPAGSLPQLSVVRYGFGTSGAGAAGFARGRLRRRAREPGRRASVSAPLVPRKFAQSYAGIQQRLWDCLPAALPAVAKYRQFNGHRSKRYRLVARPSALISSSSRELARYASPSASAQPRARIHVSSSSGSNSPRADTRKVDRADGGSHIQATERSIAGSPAARSPKSRTAVRRPPLSSKLPG